jgi:anti-sigma-K factor RskA
MEHQDYQELLESHALDALEPSEVRVLEEHLKTCAECGAELIRLRDAASLLAHAATPAAPGPEVRGRIMAAITTKQRDQPVAPPSARVVPLKARAERNIWTIGLRLAAGVALVALLIGVMVLWRRDVKMRQEVAQLSREVNTQQHELVRDRDVLGRQREALALLNSPTAKKMELAGTQTQGARGTFVYDQKTGRAILMAEGLPATSADKAYEVWFIPKGHSPMPGKIFTVDASGHAMLPTQMPAEAMDGATVAITLEPKKGSAIPTGAIYLSSPST